MKLICSCCARQIVTYIDAGVGDSYITTADGAVRGVGEEVICGNCAADLDGNGLFPEERLDEESTE